MSAHTETLDMHKLCTGRVIVSGMRTDWSEHGFDWAIDPGSIDAPETIAAGSCVRPMFPDSVTRAYPSAVSR